jgi:hypothetical protein
LNNDDNQHDLLLDDLDLSLLSDSSLTYNHCGSSNIDGSDSSYSPDSKTAEEQTDEDQFVLALKHIDEQNSKLIFNNEHKNEDNNSLSRHNLCHDIPQQPPRKIIKINSITNKSCLSAILTNDSTNKLIKTQPMVKVVSVTNNLHSENKFTSTSSSSDLQSLINYRNNAKPTIPLTNNSNTTFQMKQTHVPTQNTSNQTLNKNSLPLAKSTNNASIKVINLSQLTKQQQHTKTNISTNLFTNNTNKSNQQLIQIAGLNNLTTSTNNKEMNSNGETTTNSINGVKITKVVSSRHQTADNLVYITKNPNQLAALKTPTFTSVINANTLQPCKQLTSEYNKTTRVNNIDNLKQPGASFRYIVNNHNNHNPSQTKLDNKFSNTKAFTSYYLNNINNRNNKNLLTNNHHQSTVQSNNLHLNILNSNLNRIANINHMNIGQSTSFNDSFENNMNNTIFNPIHSDVLKNSNLYLNLYEPDEEVAIEEEEELGHAETYANYMPSKCNYF